MNGTSNKTQVGHKFIFKCMGQSDATDVGLILLFIEDFPLTFGSF
jgi:hypothetical protein